MKSAESEGCRVCIPSQLSLLQEFVQQNEMSYFHVCQVIRVALSIAPNTGWVERSYSHLTLICSKQRNRMLTSTMEVLYLLKQLNIPVKDTYRKELSLIEI